MDSLKQETQGLQKEKEVRFLYQLAYILVPFFLLILKIVFIVILKNELLEEKVWTFNIYHS